MVALAGTTDLDEAGERDHPEQTAVAGEPTHEPADARTSELDIVADDPHAAGGVLDRQTWRVCRMHESLDDEQTAERGPQDSLERARGQPCPPRERRKHDV